MSSIRTGSVRSLRAAHSLENLSGTDAAHGTHEHAAWTLCGVVCGDFVVDCALPWTCVCQVYNTAHRMHTCAVGMLCGFQWCVENVVADWTVTPLKTSQVHAAACCANATTVCAEWWRGDFCVDSTLSLKICPVHAVHYMWRFFFFFFTPSSSSARASSLPPSLPPYLSCCCFSSSSSSSSCSSFFFFPQFDIDWLNVFCLFFCLTLSVFVCVDIFLCTFFKCAYVVFVHLVRWKCFGALDYVLSIITMTFNSERRQRQRENVLLLLVLVW